MSTKPEVIGLKRSFGFGDRLGLATPGHIDAVKETSFVPVFAQQSIREMTRTRRQPEEVMGAAVAAVKAGGWTKPWGADADHLQTEDDVIRTAAAGFTMFTIDPSAHVNKQAGQMQGDALKTAFDELVQRGITKKSEIFDVYLGKRFDLGSGAVLSFDDRDALMRAAVKYSAALDQVRKMARRIRESCGSRPAEIEVSVDETPEPTSPLEHLFVGLELKRFGVPVVSLAPRFVGDFEKGIDYKGDLKLFEEHYRWHVQIATFCGPYKLSIHSGSDKFSIYPIAGRLSGELLHVKTAGTSYLEALRVICRTDVPLFRELIAFCRGRYETDKASYHVSARLDQVPEKIADKDLERWYLDENDGREIMHVTFGSVLVAGKSEKGRVFKDAIMEDLSAHADLYREVLHKHLGKHLRLLG